MTDTASILDTLGRERCAAALGVTINQVHNIAREGRFPARWYPALHGMCFAEGIDLPMSLFNWQRKTKGKRSAVAREIAQ